MIEFLGKNLVFSNYIFHRFKEGETLESIAKKYNINKNILKQICDEVYVGNCVLIPVKNKKYHIVKPTETIDSICKKYDISRNELLSKNNIKKLFIGQVLEL